MATLRKVLESVSSGKGVAQALVAELREGGAGGREVARLVLLGQPLDVSLSGMTEARSEEVSMLSSLVLWSSKGSAKVVGERGKSLSAVLERWLKLKENEKMERRVMAYRGLIASGVLGAVTAMVATLAPLLGTFVLSQQQAHQSGYLPIAAAALASMSSAMLGLYVSGRAFPVFVIVAISAFAAVYLAVSPMVDVPSLSLWAIK